MKLSIFTRIGGKYNVRSKIVEFFPKDYDRYIEPFLGGGQVFLELEKKDNVEYILNDKNKDIYHIWKDVQKAKGDILRGYDWRGSKKRYDELEASDPTDIHKRLYRNLYLSYYSFSGMRKRYSEKNTLRGQMFLKNIELIQEKLRGVKIFNKDYKEIIKKYDSPSSIIYLDPPYTEKAHLYEGQSVDPFELAKVCKEIKGKFILSYDISDKVKEAFKDFHFYRIKVPYVAGYQNTEKYEYIITNFGKTKGGLIYNMSQTFRELDGRGWINLKRMFLYE